MTSISLMQGSRRPLKHLQAKPDPASSPSPALLEILFPQHAAQNLADRALRQGLAKFVMLWQLVRSEAQMGEFGELLAGDGAVTWDDEGDGRFACTRIGRSDDRDFLDLRMMRQHV